jgi:hypothetical protein
MKTWIHGSSIRMSKTPTWWRRRWRLLEDVGVAPNDLILCSSSPNSGGGAQAVAALPDGTRS